MRNRATRRRALRGFGALVVGVSLTGCGGDDGGNTVEMTGSEFDPDYLNIEVGTTVVWENNSEVGHTVTAYEGDIPDDADYFASGGFDSEEAARDAYSQNDEDNGEVPVDGSWEHTFETPGNHDYFCIAHESTMTGRIDVEPDYPVGDH